jgi:hypothetical protein
MSRSALGGCARFLEAGGSIQTFLKFGTTTFYQWRVMVLLNRALERGWQKHGKNLNALLPQILGFAV